MGPQFERFFLGKIAYQLGYHIQTALEASTSNSQHMETLRMKFWKANIPSKIKICRWRIYNDTLPTLANLNNWGMDIGPICLFCNNKTETSSHLFWECKVTNVLWSKFCLQSNEICLGVRNGCTSPYYFDNIWKESGDDSLDGDRLSKSLVICWQIWTQE